MFEPRHTRKTGQTLVPGRHAFHIDLGRDPSNFLWDSWNAVVQDLKEDRVEPGGLYGCPIIHRETFLRLGGFPHGNVTADGAVCDPSQWLEAAMAGNLISGDAYLFGRMGAEGFKHVTCFDSLVYHMQEGEMGS